LQVGNNLKNYKLQMMLERYQPGADTGKSMLSHESEESGLVLQGRLELTVGDEVYVLNKGDAYLFNSTLPHRFRNTGREECVVVSACTPPSF
jgi:mannose-6-phosphate isomerase-like protein (cupin superfamily)